MLCQEKVKKEIKQEKDEHLLCQKCEMPHVFYEMSGMPPENEKRQTNLQDAVMVIHVKDEKKLIRANLNELKTEPWAAAIIAKMIDGRYEQSDRQVIWMFKDELLWRISDVDNERLARVCVHLSAREKILKAYHDEKSHCGIHRTAAAIRNFYYWPKLSNCVNRYINQCEFCKKQKIENAKALGHLTAPAVPERPFQHVHIDVAGPFTKTFDKQMYIIAAMDRLTKYAVARPIQTRDAETASKFLRNLMLRYGHIETVTTDNGSEFKNWKFRQVMNEFGSKQHFTSPGRAQGNGQIERFNRTLKDYMAGALETNKGWWSNAVEIAVKNYNTTIHNSTGVTPHWLLYGYHWRDIHAPKSLEEIASSRPEQLSVLSDCREFARVRLEEAHEDACERYNLRRKATHFRVGDIVVKKKLTRAESGKTTKLNPRFDGPFVIKKVLGNNTYELQLDGKAEKYHADQLRMYVPAGTFVEKE